MAGQPLPRGGEPHGALAAVDERDIELALQRGDLLRDGRRSERQRAGGRADAAVLATASSTLSLRTSNM